MKNLILDWCVKSYLTLVFSVLALTPVFAEGSKQLAPGNNSIDSPAKDTIAIVQMKFSSSTPGMAFPGCDDNCKLYFNIQDHLSETVSLGLSYQTNNDAVQSTSSTYYYKIYDPTGNLVKTGAVGGSSGLNANLWKHELVENGPNIPGIGTGYDTTGYLFNPGMNGDHYIEFMDDLSDNSLADIPSGFGLMYLDITVFENQGSTNNEIIGRVHSKGWYLRTDDTGYPSVAGYSSQFVRPFAGTIYVLDSTNSVSFLDFSQSGFRGLGFRLSFNSDGPLETGTLQEKRQSQLTRNLDPEYKVFLNPPDSLVYTPSPKVNLYQTSHMVFNQRCDTTDLCIEVIYDGVGQIRILLDYHGGDGFYTAGTEDILLEQALNSSGRDTICIPYGGKDGLNNQLPIASIADVNIYSTFLQGVMHFAMEDVEYMTNGFEIKGYRPSRTYVARPRWDDRLIYNAGFLPYSGATDSLVLEDCGSNTCRYWTNFDFGNVHAINNWWNTYEDTTSTSGLKSVIQEGCPYIKSNDEYDTTGKNTPVDIFVLQNDSISYSQFDTSTLTVKIGAAPSNGSAVVNPNGTITYTPSSGYIGNDVFEYIICDTGVSYLGLAPICDTSFVFITVLETNEPPVINDTTIFINEDEISLICPVILDENNDPLNIAFCSTPLNGAVQLNGDSCFEYTPMSNFNGTETICVQVCDIEGVCDSGLITLIVNAVNDKPVAQDDSNSTNEDTPVSGDASTNDSDIDNDPLSFAVLTNPNNGTVTMTSTGSYTYTPNANYNGTDVFTYTIDDGNGGKDTASVTITINAINDKPVAQDDTNSTNEDTPVSGDASTNDSDTDNDPLTFVVLSNPNNGTVTMTSTGSYTYTPNANYNGTDVFTYTIDDGNGGIDTASVTITINAVNDKPVAQDDTNTTNEDTPVSGDASTNDSDIDNDPLSFAVLTNPNNGTVTMTSTGSYTYTPNANYNGADAFTYTIDDGNGGIDTATVNLTINAINDKPVAQDDSNSTNEDTPVSGDASTNDSDIDNDPLSFAVLTNPNNGTVTMTSTGSYTYTPNANYNGTDVFIYTINDGNGGKDTASVTITINAVNDKPVAQDDSNSTNEDTPVSGDASTNDSDIDNDPLTFVVLSNPSNGTVTMTSTGSYTYTPNANYNGTDVFTYTINDGNGGKDTASVTITINAVNDKPVAQDDSNTTNEDTPVSGNASTNDSDIDNDPLSFAVLTNPNNGTVTMTSTGSYTYTPNANYNGTDVFTYTINDGNGGIDTATVNLTINAINDKPVAQDDSNSTNEDTPVSGDASTNDSDIDNDPLSFAVLTNPNNGTVTMTSTGSYTYTPNANYNGTDVFTYTIDDGNGGKDTASVTITINAVNDKPVAQDDSNSTNEDTPVSGDASTNDSDIDNDPLTFVVLSNPSNGTVTMTSTGSYTYTPNANYNGTDVFTYTIDDGNGGKDTASVTITINAVNDKPVAQNDVYSGPEDVQISGDLSVNDSDIDNDPLIFTINSTPNNGSVALNQNGTFVYTPNQNFYGLDVFSYIIDDNNGGLDTAFVTITITPLNDKPVAQDDTNSTNEDIPVNGNVSTNDSDVDNDPLTFAVLSNPSNGAVSLASNGTYTYSPNANYFGMDAFTYTIDDGNGGKDTATVTITINAINDKPVAQDDNNTTNEDTPVNGDVSVNDSDLDNDPLTFSILANPSDGSVSMNPDGSYTYTPDANYNGSDVFTYIVDDGNGGKDTAQVIVTIEAINDGPVALNDYGTTAEETVINIDLIANDNDNLDGGGIDAASITLIQGSGPNSGNVVFNVNGTIDYTPNIDFWGVDSFKYSVNDLGTPTPVKSTTAWVFITIQPVNDKPVATDDFATTNEDKNVEINVAQNDNDSKDNGTLNLSSVSIVKPFDPVNGTVSIDAISGTINYTPFDNYNGKDSFAYSICDQGFPYPALCDTAWVYVDIISVPDTPVIGQKFCDYSAALISNTNISITGVKLNGAILPLNYPYPSLYPAANFINDLNVYLNGNGFASFQLSPVPSIQVDSSSYVFNNIQFSNGTQYPFSQTNCITVTGLNDLYFSIYEGDSIETCFEVLDNDLPADTLTCEVISNPLNGTVSLDQDNCLKYVPNENYYGLDTIVKTVCDTTSNFCDTVLVIVNVVPVNDPPVARNDYKTILEEMTATLNVCKNDNDSLDFAGLDPLSVNIIAGTGPNNGTATVLANGMVQYQPDSNFNGIDSFKYSISDTGVPKPGLLAYAWVIINIIEENDYPVISDTSAVVPEDSSVVICPEFNDPDSSDVLSLALCQPGHQNGTVGIQNNCLVYTPNPDFNGNDTLCVMVCDQYGFCDTTSITVIVTPANDSPVINDTLVHLNEDQSIQTCPEFNDIDVNDQLTISLCSTPLNGTATLTGNCINYMPSSGFNGLDSICVQVCDQDGACDQATIIFNVNPVNDKPIALNDSFSTNEEISVTFNVSLNDSDPIDNGSMNPNSVAVLSGTGPYNGNLTNNGGSSFTYVPSPNFNGVDSFQYSIEDNGIPLPALADSAWVYITVLPSNDPPVVNDTTVVVDEDSVITVCIEASDIDLGDSLSISLCSSSNSGSASIIGGCVVYQPNEDFNGSDTICVVVCDAQGACDTATIIVNVDPVNDNPFISDTSVIIAENGTTIVCPEFGDIDDNDTLTLTICEGLNNGIATVNGNCVDITPALNFNGEDSLCIVICDQNGACDTATIYVTVTGVNNKPQANNDSASTNEDESVNIDLLANDNDAADNNLLNVSTLQIVVDAINGNITINNDGTVNYEPNSNFYGNDSFQYSICDYGMPSPVLCDSAMVYVSVISVPDTPGNFQIVCDHAVATISNSSVTITSVEIDGKIAPLNYPYPSVYPATAFINDLNALLAGNGFAYAMASPFPSIVIDKSTLQFGDITFSNNTINPFIASNCDTVEAADTLYFSIYEDDSVETCFITMDNDGSEDPLTCSIVEGGSNGSTSIEPGNCVKYIPNANYFGRDTIIKQTCDSNSNWCDTVWIIVNMIPLNDAPFANNDYKATVEETVVSINVVSNDNDATDFADVDPASVTIQQQPINGSLINNQNGTIDYTPNANFNGLDSFSYEVSDTGVPLPALQAQAWVYITVSGSNDAPVIIDTTISGPEDSIIIVCPEISDLDTGSVLTVTLCGGPENGTAIVIDNCIQIEPDTNFFGSDTICVIVCDEFGWCDTGEIVIIVEPRNDKPSIEDAYVTIPEDDTKIVCPVINDIDPGDALTVSICDGPENGTATLNGNCIEIAPGTNFIGKDTMCVVVCDQDGLCDTASIFITVTPTNDPPVIGDTGVITIEDSCFIICPDISDIDSGDVLTIAICDTPEHASVEIIGLCIKVCPDPDFVGTDSICIIVCDQHGNCDTGYARFTVTPVNDAPVLQDTVVHLDQNDSITVCLNAFDVDNDPLTYGLCGSTVNGTVSTDGTCFKYKPDRYFNGSDSVCVIVCDTSGACDTAMLYFIVDPLNCDIPFAKDFYKYVIPGTSVTVDAQSSAVNPGGTNMITSIVTTPTQGTLTVVSGGKLEFTPDSSFYGQVSMQYELCNGCGCDTALFVVQYLDTIVSVPNDTVIIIVNANVPKNSVLDTCLSGLGINLDSSIIIDPQNGTVVVSDSCFTYAPDSNFTGTDTIIIILCGDTINDTCNQIIIIIDVSQTALRTLAVNDEYRTLMDVEVELNVLSNDSFNEFSPTIELLNFPSNGVLFDQSGGIYNYLPDEGFFGIDSFYYELTDSTPLGIVSDTAMVTIVVTGEAGIQLEIFIPNAFSPNNDGVNDEFVIGNILLLYPNASITIYNRFGDEVYGTQDVGNEPWKGINKSGEMLPTGTYYFLLNLNDKEEKMFTGFVSLER